MPDLNITKKRIRWQILLLCAIPFLWTSCDQTTSVGGSIVPDRNIIASDTLIVPSLEPSTRGKDSLNAYTGDLVFLSAGSYNDPWFGPITANSYILPSLLLSGLVDTIDEKTIATLRLVPTTIYGDTISTARFGLYRVTQRWRPSEFRAKTKVNVEATPFATFEMSTDTAVTVTLPSAWLNEYKEFVYSKSTNKDSAYVRNYYGFAIKSLDEGKVFSFPKDSIKINFYNPKDTNTVFVRASAYNFTRQASSKPSTGFQVSSNQENLPSFILKLDLNKLKDVNISRAVIRLEEIVDLVPALPPGHKRPNSLVLSAYSPAGLLDPNDIIVLTPAITFIRQTDNSYQANVTNLVRQMIVSGESEKRYYLAIQPRSGIMHNLMISNTYPKQPRLILSVVKRSEQ